MYLEIDHVVIVVRDLDKAVATFRDRMGLTLAEVRDVPRSKVRAAFFSVGHGNIEVIEPTDPTSLPARFLEEHGEGFYQVSLQVADLDDTAATLRNNGIAISREDINPPPNAGRRRLYPDPATTMGAVFQLIEGANRYAAVE